LLVLALLASVGVWLWLSAVADSYREEPYTLIEDGLYVGASVHDPPPGTKAVLNLCDRRDPYQVDAALWEPIPDGGKAPDLEWLRRVVKFVGDQRQAGAVVYVHCAAGVSRSGFVATAFVMAEHGWSRDRALGFVRARRPQVRPNPYFLKRLAEWEQALQER
jgi:hypothetical protein